MAARRKAKRQINIVYIGIGVFIIAIAALLLLRTDDPENPGNVNIKDEVPAEWSSNGLCESREGILIGMCCTTWNDATQTEERVDCSELVAQQQEIQAFLTLGQDKLERLSSIGFVIKAINEGNIDGRVGISSIGVTTLNGDQAGIDEIKSKMSTIVGTFKQVGAGQSVDFPMAFQNRILLDIPAGTNAYQMADGTYTVTISLEFEDENGQIASAGSRTIDLIVEQEKIAFSIDVVPS